MMNYSSTILKHIALVYKNRSEADLILSTLFGLSKESEKMLSPELSDKLFGISEPLPILNYKNDAFHAEVFIMESIEMKTTNPSHICVEVDDADVLLNKCRDTNLKIVIIPKDIGRIVFICDQSGNMYEIKSRK